MSFYTLHLGYSLSDSTDSNGIAYGPTSGGFNPAPGPGSQTYSETLSGFWTHSTDEPGPNTKFTVFGEDANFVLPYSATAEPTVYLHVFWNDAQNAPPDTPAKLTVVTAVGRQRNADQNKRSPFSNGGRAVTYQIAPVTLPNTPHKSVFFKVGTVHAAPGMKIDAFSFVIAASVVGSGSQPQTYYFGHDPELEVDMGT